MHITRREGFIILTIAFFTLLTNHVLLALGTRQKTEMWSAGANFEGDSGLSGLNWYTYPIQGPFLNPTIHIKQIVGSYSSVWYQDESDEWWAYGRNEYVKLGDPSLGGVTPQKLPFSTTKTIKQMCGGDDHSVYLTTDNRLYAGGDASYFGSGCLSSSPSTPTEINYASYDPSVDPPVILKCGDFSTQWVTQSGKVYSCGYNYGNIDGQTWNNQNAASLHAALDSSSVVVEKLAIGLSHSLFVSSDNYLYGSGENSAGQINDSPNFETYNSIFLRKEDFFDDKQIREVYAGTLTSIILTDNPQALYSLGNNEYGVLGRADTDTSYDGIHQVDISPLQGKYIVELSLGPRNTYVLVDDGSVFSMGMTEDGALADGRFINGIYIPMSRLDRVIMSPMTDRGQKIGRISARLLGITMLQAVTCGGIIQRSPYVCSSHGTCEDDQTCTCSFGYWDSLCQTKCLPGKYSLGVTANCTSCPISTYSVEGAATISECFTCTEGHYCPSPGLINPTPCPTGTYNSQTGSSSDSDCLPCPIGSFANATGSVSCTPCAPGTYAASVGSDFCTPCPFNTSNVVEGSTSISNCSMCPKDTYLQGISCISCPDNHYTVSYGSSSQSDCLRCNPGTFYNGTHCALLPPRRLYSVGQNGHGQLGVGDYTVREVLTEISFFNNKFITQFDGLGFNSFVATSDHSIYGFGYNGDKQVSYYIADTWINSPALVNDSHIPNDDPIVKICGTFEDSMFVTEKHRIFLTGTGLFLGQSSAINNVMIGIREIETYGDLYEDGQRKAITDSFCGLYHKMFLDGNNTIYCQGRNFFGICGAELTHQVYGPSIVDAMHDLKIKKAATGKFHALYLTVGGELYALGDNTYGQMGVGAGTTTEVGQRYLINVAGKKVRDAWSGVNNNMAVTTDETLYVWGRNNDGELGLGSTGTVDTPTVLSTSSFGMSAEARILDIVFGQALDRDENTYILDSNGIIYSCGTVTESLGNAGASARTTFASVTMPSGVTFEKIATGRYFLLAQEAFKCGEYSAADSRVCSGRGTCTRGVCFCDIGSYGESCLQCPAGTFGAIENDVAVCKNCPIGTYQPQQGATSNSACLPCLYSTYADVEGLSQCKPCPPNTYFPNIGSTNSSVCIPVTTPRSYSVGLNTQSKLGFDVSIISSRSTLSEWLLSTHIGGLTPTRSTANEDTIFFMISSSLTSHEVWSLGSNQYQHRGSSSSSPTKINLPSTQVLDICALKEGVAFLIGDGSLNQIYVQGTTKFGSLSMGSTSTQVISSPTQINYGAMNSFERNQIFCGDYNLYVSSSDHGLYGSGLNQNRQLNDGSVTNRGSLISMGSPSVKYFCAGLAYSMAVSSSGELMFFGTPPYSDTDSILNFFDNSDIRQVYCYGSNYMILTQDKGNDKLYAWGENSVGQLSISSQLSFTEPVDVNIDQIQPAHIVQISMSESNSYLLDSSGKIYSAGNTTACGVTGISSGEVLSFTPLSLQLVQFGYIQAYSNALMSFEAITCNNILSTDPQVCGGGGTCDLDGKCLCKLGYRTSSNSADCSPCEPGSYASTPGTCVSCPSGTYSSIYSALSCAPCPSGTYNPKNGSSSLSDCISAPAGSYVPTQGANQATLCPAGTYNPTTGATNVTFCSICPAGEYTSSDGAKWCATCSAGSYSSSDGSTSCTLCSAGTFSSSDGATGCTSCPPGEYASSEGSTSCSLCAVGTFTNSSGSTHCTSCQNGTYASFEGSIECDPCPPGEYTSSRGSSWCLDCPRGTFSSVSGAISCDLCSPGTYAPSTHSTSCSLCPAGTFSSEWGMYNVSRCLQSPTGTWSASGSTAFVPCPPGYVSPVESTTSSDCTPCPAGTYSVNSSDTYPIQITCQSCSAGYYGGLSGQSSFDAACTPCNSGYYQPIAGSVGIDSCIACPKGTYNDRSAASSLLDCILCPVDTFQPDIGQTNCLNCSEPDVICLRGSAQKLPASDSFTSSITSVVDPRVDYVPSTEEENTLSKYISIGLIVFFIIISLCCACCCSICICCVSRLFFQWYHLRIRRLVRALVKKRREQNKKTTKKPSKSSSAAKYQQEELKQDTDTKHDEQEHDEQKRAEQKYADQKMDDPVFAMTSVEAQLVKNGSNDPLILQEGSKHNDSSSSVVAGFHNDHTHDGPTADKSPDVDEELNKMEKKKKKKKSRKRKTMDGLRGFLRKVDFFFQNKHWTRVGDHPTRDKTACGGIHSLVALIVIGVVVIFQLSDLFYNNTITVESFKTRAGTASTSAAEKVSDLGDYTATFSIYGVWDNCNVNVTAERFSSVGATSCATVTNPTPSCACSWRCSNCTLVGLAQSITFNAPSKYTGVIRYTVSVPHYMPFVNGTKKPYETAGTILSPVGKVFHGALDPSEPSYSPSQVYLTTYYSVYFPKGYGLFSPFVDFLKNFESSWFNDDSYYGLTTQLQSVVLGTSTDKNLQSSADGVSLQILFTVSNLQYIIQDSARVTTMAFISQVVAISGFIIAIIAFGLNRCEECDYRLKSRRRARQLSKKLMKAVRGEKKLSKSIEMKTQHIANARKKEQNALVDDWIAEDMENDDDDERNNSSRGSIAEKMDNNEEKLDNDEEEKFDNATSSGSEEEDDHESRMLSPRYTTSLTPRDAIVSTDSEDESSHDGLGESFAPPSFIPPSTDNPDEPSLVEESKIQL